MQKKVRTLVKSLRQNTTHRELTKVSVRYRFCKNLIRLFSNRSSRCPPSHSLRDPTPLQALLKGGGCADSSPPLPGDRPSQVAHSRPRGPREGGVEKGLSLSAWGVCGEAGRGGGGELSPSCGPEADAVGSTGASQTARGPGTRWVGPATPRHSESPYPWGTPRPCYP